AAMTASNPSASRAARASCASQAEEKASTVTSLESSYPGSSISEKSLYQPAVADQRQQPEEHGAEEERGERGGDDPRPPPPQVRHHQIGTHDAEQHKQPKQQERQPHFSRGGGHGVILPHAGMVISR